MYQIIIGTPQGELDSKLYPDLGTVEAKMTYLYTGDYSQIELSDGKLLYLSNELVKSYYFFVAKVS